MKPGVSRSQSGFTLIELVIVMSISILLFTMLLPMTRSVLDSFHLTQALNVVLGALDEAKERSLSMNRPMEVWICRSTVSNPSHYRFIQLFSQEPSGKLKPVGRAIELPTGICITANSDWSSLMLRDPDPLPDRPRVGRLEMNYAYRQLTFYPSGTTNLASDGTKWFLTVMSEYSETQNVLAKNFATIQIDPINGLTTARQP